MSRVITFSRRFPSYHPRKGERTFFIEKIVEGMLKLGTFEVSDETLRLCGIDGPYNKYDVENIKYHTIREGKRWKVGDKFSPRVWGNDVNPKTGRTGPYQSKQIIISDDIEIKKVWDLEMIPCDNAGALYYRILLNRKDFPSVDFIAANDGLSFDEFEGWFDTAKTRKKGFDGQIICWNENISYAN